jgi:hypothetical protein
VLSAIGIGSGGEALGTEQELHTVFDPRFPYPRVDVEVDVTPRDDSDP